MTAVTNTMYSRVLCPFLFLFFNIIVPPYATFLKKMFYCYILIVGEFLFYHLLGRLNRTKHVGAHRNHSSRNQSNDNGIFYYVLTSFIDPWMPHRAHLLCYEDDTCPLSPLNPGEREFKDGALYTAITRPLPTHFL